MSGGFFQFGPTYNSTAYVRALIEGSLNGFHKIDAAGANAVNGELAGKFAAVKDDGAGNTIVGVAKDENAVGLFREDVKDMINASDNATFYFRGGEYYIAESRLGDAITNFTVGEYVTSDANGAAIPTSDKTKALGIVTYVGGTFPMGNMYHWAGDAANGGKFLGISLLV